MISSILYAFLNRFLPLFEDRAIADYEKLSTTDVTPIWIIAPPRSGTTVTYQLLCKHLNTNYLTNFVGNCYKAPIIADKIQKRFLHHQSITLTSDYGRTSGWYGPHEGGQFLYRFFSRDEHYSDENWVSEEVKKRFRTFVNILGRETGFFLLKNTVNSLRIKALNSMFPNSKFIYVKRNEIDTLISMYNARKNQNQINNWWSVKPPGYKNVQKNDLLTQVIWQYDQINAIIQRDLKTLDIQPVIVNYEELCRDQELVIKAISEATGIALKSHIAFSNIVYPRKQIDTELEIEIRNHREE